jgi:hypothetical protein
MSEGFAYVNTIVYDKVLRGQDNAQSESSGVGFRHISTPDHIPGLRFCFVDEDEELDLRRHHNAISNTKPPAEVVQEVNDGGQTNTVQETAQPLTPKQLRQQARKNKQG